MAAFDFNGLSTAQINDLTALAMASYVGNSPPSGWSVVTGQTIGGGAYTGNTFTNGNAAARVYRSGDTLTVSFRGTDDVTGDLPDIVSLLTGNSYINEFSALLNAVAAYAAGGNGISSIQVTGHSLGGAAVNILRNVSSSQFGGAFDDATYMAIAAPKISTNANILNIGHENDWAFKQVETAIPFGPTEFFSTTDHIVWYNDLLALNNDLGLGIRSLTEFIVNADSSPHGSDNYIDTIQRITSSEFYGQTTRDMTILVAATDLTITPLGSQSSNATGPALILGRDGANDALKGAGFGDFLEGLGGNDYLEGRAGSDRISGGTGRDELIGGAGNDTLDGGTGQDVAFFLDAGTGLSANLNQGGVNAISQAGNDRLSGIEALVSANGNDNLIGNGADNLFASLGGSDTLIGNGGDDMLIAGAGAGDSLSGGSGGDVLDVTDSNGSVLTGGSDADTFIFDGRIALDESNGNTHRITDYNDAQDFIIIDTFFNGAVFGDLTITQLGSATRIEIGSLDLRLDNTQTSEIDAGDILLV